MSDTTDIIFKAMRLSTAHMPNLDPEWGEVRYTETEYGFVFWPTEYVEELPDWLRPINQYALDNDIEIVEFDQDNYTFDQFKEYDW